MTALKRYTVFLIALNGMATGSCQASQPTASAPLHAPESASPALSTLTIRSGTARHVFKVEMASTAAEQERGLMYRKLLPVDGGMLFPFDPPVRATFWMKNTLISLDMIFIRPDGTIARIAARTTPLSLEPVDAGEKIIAVLEIVGGGAAAAGISEGDRVSWAGGPN